MYRLMINKVKFFINYADLWWSMLVKVLSY